MRISPLVAILTVSLSAPVMAQETEPAREIVVLGRPLDPPPGDPAHGTIVIDRSRLEAEASGRLENALGALAGFQQFRRSDSRSANPSAQGVALRALGGNASSRTLVLLDGVPQADPFFGYIPFSALSTDRIASARVTRGGVSGAFGAGAVAGSINLASAARDDLPLFSAQALGGSRVASELSASLSPDIGAGFISLTGRWDRGDGFFTTPADQRTSASVPARYDSWSAGVRAVAPLSEDMELQANVAIFRDDRTLRFAGADSFSDGQDASLRLIARGRWQVDALAYLQARDFGNVVVSATSFRPVLDQRQTPSTGIGGKIELRPPLGDAHALRFGADLRIVDGTMFEDALNATSGAITARRQAGGLQRTVGLFAEDDWTLGRLVLSLGGRIDRWAIDGGYFAERNGAGATVLDTRFADRAGWETTGRAGLLWRGSERLSLRAAAYAGYRLPTLNELYRPFTVFPVTTRANAALAPERLRGAEIGADWAPVAGVKLSATGFINRLDGGIANVTIATNLRERRNVDAIEAKGVELSGQARLGEIDLAASYAFSDARVIGSGVSVALDGMRPAQTPRHVATASAAWMPATGPGIAANLRYVGGQYEDDLESDLLPAALTIDGYARWRFANGLTLVGRVENIFDETVVTRNAAGSIDLGTPRTLWLGVRLER